MLLLVHSTTVNHVQKQNKVVGFFYGWALYHAMHLENVLVNSDQSLLKGILANSGQLLLEGNIDLGVDYGDTF